MSARLPAETDDSGIPRCCRDGASDGPYGAHMLRVLVVPRRDRATLAAVVGPGEREGYVRVVTSEGREFAFPTAGALLDLTLDAEAADPAQALRKLESRLPEPVPWADVHAAALTRAGESFRLLQLAELVGLDASEARLAQALDAGASAPWFRRERAWFVPAAPEELERRLAARERRRVEARSDDALVHWWHGDPESAPPEDAADALDALLQFAASADADRHPRGRKLANGLQLGEPDLILEALDGLGLLPDGFDPGPARCGLPPFRESEVAAARRLVRAPDPVERLDLTSAYTVAIDDERTTEVDDALSFRALDDGWELLVHVADVAAAVLPETQLDALARKRASSAYLPEGTLPMLPVPLYRDRLSLAVGEPRAAITGRFLFDREFELRSTEFLRSTVTLDARLVYGRDDGPTELTGDADSGRAVLELADALRARRVEAGAVVLGLPSLRIERTDGTTRIGVRTAATPGDRVVGECMILLSAEAGRVLDEAGLPAGFRAQDAPRKELPAAEDPLFPVRAVRCLSPTRTGTRAERHHGLGVAAYAQVTSPIRRYGDLVNQRQLLAAVGLEPVAPHSEEQLEPWLVVLLERERHLRRATGRRESYWVAREVEDGRLVPRTGVLNRPPRRGRGAVWSPELLREVPLVVPRGWEVPAEGEELAVRVHRVLPWRGRVELAPDG